MTRRFYTIDELKSLACDNMLAIAKQLCPHGALEGGNRWREASTRAGGLGDSLYIYIGGPKVGGWMFQGEGHVNPLGFIAFAATGGDKAEAVRWLRKWLGIDEGRAPTPRPAEIVERERAAAEHERARREQKARGLWLASAPIEGTPVEDYLAARGIDLALLPRPPGGVRYHAELWHSDTGQRHPAMLWAITGAGGTRQIGTHITWLMQHGPNGWGKLVPRAPIAGFKAKKVYGAQSGGLIPIARGVEGTPIRRAKGPRLHLTEGVEDALAVACTLPEERVAAAVSLGNLAALARNLPAAIDTLVWWQQNDAAGSKAAELLGRMIDGVLQTGRAIELAQVPAQFKDVNDLYREGA